MRIMGLDFGSKTVGVAVSDSLLVTAQGLEIIRREKIYTDCADFDNFKKSLTEVNQVLDSRGLRLAVWEDCVYCDCEYTLLLLKKELAEQTARWQSENFEIYL